VAGASDSQRGARARGVERVHFRSCRGAAAGVIARLDAGGAASQSGLRLARAEERTDEAVKQVDNSRQWPVSAFIMRLPVLDHRLDGFVLLSCEADSPLP
jgi:hypothetical protein